MGNGNTHREVTVSRRFLPIAAALAALNVHCAVSAEIPKPQDTAYEGTITLRVDATDISRRLFRVHETIPVKPGDLVLQYAKWLPGNHAPNGPIDQLAGPSITADGKPVEWTRDPLDVYSFDVSVPKGVGTLELDLQFASPEIPEQGRITMTAAILGVQWEKMLLYPAGHYISRIRVDPSVMLPPGWQFACALDGAQRDGQSVHFSAVPLNTLIDSPLFAGVYFKRVQLDASPQAPVYLNIVADSPDELDMSPTALAAHRKLVAEATELFASRHFDHYDFLLAISDEFGAIGLEHHRSSEDGTGLGYFKQWDRTAARRDLLPHEFTHSWNGKFRRPADLWTPTLNVPMQDSLLWVYEGQTQYWGIVLAARSGLWTGEMARGALGWMAATFQEQRPGRSWRNLQDTTNQPIISPRRPQSFVSWQRTEDYYREGALMWLEVDTRLRSRTGGKRSLDDFARNFFGVRDGSYVTMTYTFADVARALNDLLADDWSDYLHTRLDTHQNTTIDAALADTGWRLVFRDTPSVFLQRAQEANETVDRTFSIGLALDKQAKISQVIWDSAAFKAGLTLGTSVVAVNGRAYKAELLDQAIRDAQDPTKPVELLVRDLDRYRTVKLDYTGGLRYPDLVRTAGSADRLTDILRPRT
jgi:predicted metalloprotease with PDZ domain